MDLSTKALIGIIAITLVLIIVIYPLAPSWFMAFPILFGTIAFSFDKRRRRSPEDRDSQLGSSSSPRPPTDDGVLQSGSQIGSPQGDDGLFQNGSSSGDVQQHLVGETRAPLPLPRVANVVGGMRRRKPFDPKNAPPPAGDAPPPAGDAPPPASDAPPPAGDALAPGLAVVAGGMRRRKPFDPKNAPPPAGDAPPPAGDSPPPASDAPPPAGDALAPGLVVVAGGMRRRKPFDPKNAPPPAGDAPPPAGDAPPPASDAPPPAGDALAPGLAVVAGGMERGEPAGYLARWPDVLVEARKRIEQESSSMSSSYDVSSSSTSSSYDVFLSFRGSKTCLDHLHKGLVSAGITVEFIDNEQLKDDKQLGDDKQLIAELNEAISQSRTYIPILSIDYASSKWCLRELAMMLECKRSYGKTIMPIFYDVSPSDVRYQAEDFGRAFNGVGVDSNTMETWRMALRQVGNISGYSWNSFKGDESELIKEVVLPVARMLRDDGLAVTEKLFGVDHHIQEIMKKLGIAYSNGQATDVRGQPEAPVVGLWGVKGIGKTTLAKAIYNEVHGLFESHSFLEGINLKKVWFSRQMLIADLQPFEPRRRKRALIVLDDVDNYDYMGILLNVVSELCDFGSRIIVTREKYFLEPPLVQEHKVEPMSDDHALQLFCHHAFQGDAPEEVSDPEYDSLSKDIVKAVGRVPGDIVRLASYLRRNMGVDNWRSTLELLQKHGKERQAAL